MAINPELLIQEFRTFHQNKNVVKILDHLKSGSLSGEQSEKTTLRRMLWPVPTVWDLEIICGFVESRKISKIYSIGCGTGLLEWLILEIMDAIRRNNNRLDGNPSDLPIDAPHSDSSTNETSKPLTLTGVEIDSQWWKSKYAPPQFIPLLFAGEDFPLNTAFGSETDLVMFSYFNNLKAFREYLHSFGGTYVIIIGPTHKQFCAPSPMDLKHHPDLPTDDWNIILYQRFGVEPVDYIAIYSRVQRIEDIETSISSSTYSAGGSPSFD